MARMQRSLFDQLNALAEEISQSPVKTAGEKASAGPVPSDPGGYQGASSHPSVSVENDVQAAGTGARASEYEADIKDQQGALAVDNAPEMSQEGRQDDVQLNIGTNAAATGDDPAAEKDYKGDKDDPGTAHPAKTNDGEKYSSASFKEAQVKCAELGNDILADLANFGASKLEAPAAKEAELHGDQHKLDKDNDGKIEGSDLAALRNDDDDSSDDDDDDDDEKEAAEKKETAAAAEEKEAAYAAGYELAQKLGVEKQAAEAAVQQVCANTLVEADQMADLLIGFMKSSNDMLDDAAGGEDHSAESDIDSGASDAPDMPAAADDAAAEELMGAPEAAGEPSDEEAMQELAMALEELGIPPEALLAEVAGGGDAAAPAPEEMMAAEAAPKMAAADDLSTIGRAVVNFKRAGKFQVKEARTKRSRELRDMWKQHLLELTSR